MQKITKSQTKRLVVNLPDSMNRNAINLLDEGQLGNGQLKLMQKHLESKTGCQKFSPRTTKPPFINKLDHKMYQTLATRHFNQQVLEKLESIDESRRSQNSAMDSVRRS